MKAVKMLGINDEVTTCECCGKTNLKKTVVLSIDGAQVHYGTQCASRAFRFGRGACKLTARKIEQEARLIQIQSHYASGMEVWL